jgi:hypothetical protein
MTSASCLQNTVIKSYTYRIFKAECKSRVNVCQRNLQIVQKTLVRRCCNFRRWVSATHFLEEQA